MVFPMLLSKKEKHLDYIKYSCKSVTQKQQYQLKSISKEIG